MRELIFDTETTGLSPERGDRLVSLAAIEIVDYQPTGRFVHYFLNPERESNPGALSVHGLTTEFLSTQPKFVDIAQEFCDFWAQDNLIIHNSPFDTGFLRAELARAGRTIGGITSSCTLNRARSTFGSGNNKLDNLVARFGIRNLRADTGKHGALIDCLLLLPVYQYLRGVPVTQLTDEFLKTYGVVSNESGQSTNSQGVDNPTQGEAISPPISSGLPGDGQVTSGHPEVSDAVADGESDAGLPKAGDVARYRRRFGVVHGG